MRVAALTPGRDEHIVIPPNQVVVVSTFEKVCMPDDMIGHLTLKQDILLQGLIMASQSQIDAGYRGWIYPLFYNLTDRPVTLQLKQSIIRLELVRLEQATDEPYKGDYQGKKLAESLKHPIGSSLAELRKDVKRNGEEVQEERERINSTRVFATFLSVALAAVAVAVPFVTGLVGDVARLEGEVRSPVKLERDVKRLKVRVAKLQCEVRNQGDPAARRRC